MYLSTMDTEITHCRLKGDQMISYFDSKKKRIQSNSAENSNEATHDKKKLKN